MQSKSISSFPFIFFLLLQLTKKVLTIHYAFAYWFGRNFNYCLQQLCVDISFIFYFSSGYFYLLNLDNTFIIYFSSVYFYSLNHPLIPVYFGSKQGGNLSTLRSHGSNTGILIIWPIQTFFNQDKILTGRAPIIHFFPLHFLYTFSKQLFLLIHRSISI